MASSQFALNVARFAARAQGNADQVLRKVALDMMGRIVRRSPVDTGRFRNNWLASVGHMATITTDIVDKSGQAAIARATTAVGTARMGQRIYLSNSLPYARALEYGHSRQAPQGMVRITVAEYEAVVRRAVGEGK